MYSFMSCIHRKEEINKKEVLEVVGWEFYQTYIFWKSLKCFKRRWSEICAQKEERVPGCRILPAERDPQADPICPTNKFSLKRGKYGVRKNLKGNEQFSSHHSAHLALMCSCVSPHPFPSSPAEPWLWRGKILIKTLQKAENAWNKVTVTVKCPERPIRNCNTGSFITTSSSLIINQWILLEKKKKTHISAGEMMLIIFC